MLKITTFISRWVLNSITRGKSEEQHKMVKSYVDISEMTKDTDIKDISSVLAKYEEIHLLTEELKKYLRELEDITKVFMKERKWTTYADQTTKVTVSIKNEEKKSIDIKMLEVVVTEEQISKIVKKNKKEIIEIITKDKLERLKQYGKK